MITYIAPRSMNDESEKPLHTSTDIRVKLRQSAENEFELQKMDFDIHSNTKTFTNLLSNKLQLHTPFQ